VANAESGHHRAPLFFEIIVQIKLAMSQLMIMSVMHSFKSSLQLYGLLHSHLNTIIPLLEPLDLTLMRFDVLHVLLV
jgi:hypothetical protein